MPRKERTDKIAILARQKETIFHTQDLMVLWGIYNKNTLYTTIKRLVKNGSLYSIQKGMYSLLPISAIDPWLLGIKALHGFCYVSTESILSKTGVVNQLSLSVTLVGEKSLKFKVAGHDFICRKLNDKFLHNTAGIIEINGIRQASLERAAADMLYFNPKFHFDNKKLINFRKVNELRKIFYDFA
ncbi:MAG: hypothetical protein WC659_06765 [Patescibacteria group bacterium]